MLRWLYRWPLFIPFIVAAQCMRTFLAKNGMMNNALVALGLIDPLQRDELLDWRGIVIAFVWKQTPFVTLLLAGAMASLDRSTIEAARNLGASRLRVLIEIVLPQVAPTLLVGLVLSFVTMLSVLSVPMMMQAAADDDDRRHRHRQHREHRHERQRRAHQQRRQHLRQRQLDQDPKREAPRLRPASSVARSSEASAPASNRATNGVCFHTKVMMIPRQSR